MEESEDEITRINRKFGIQETYHKYYMEIYLILSIILFVIMIVLSILSYGYLDSGSKYFPSRFIEFLPLFIIIIFCYFVVYLIQIRLKNPFRFKRKYEYELKKRVSRGFDLHCLFGFTPLIIFFIVIIFFSFITAQYNININENLIIIIAVIIILLLIFYFITRDVKNTYISINYFLMRNEKIIYSSLGKLDNPLLGSGNGTFFLTNLNLIFLPSPYSKYSHEHDELIIPLDKIISISKKENEDHLDVHTEVKIKIYLNNLDEWKENLIKHTNIDVSAFTTFN
jgi:FtsH-binding integral membrane protein